MELDVEVDLLGQRGQHQVLVVDGDGRIGFDQVTGHFAGPFRLQPHGLGLIGIQRDNDVLDVQDDVRDVLHHTIDAGELVRSVLNLDSGNGGAFQAGQQDATQAVADGGPEAAFERLDRKLTVSRRVVGVRDDPMRQFKSAPSDSHDWFSDRFPAALG